MANVTESVVEPTAIESEAATEGGSAPQPPETEIKLLITPRVSESSDHYGRGTLMYAKNGDAIAEVTPPEAAQAAIGEGVALDPDGSTLRATVDGRVVVEGFHVRVDKALMIQGSVDFSTGHIKFDGDVTIFGDVADLFHVRAEGELHVHGVIEAAEVRAGRGLRADGGISAKGKGRVSVEGDVVAKYAVNCTLAATGDITARMLAHSRVICGGQLKVTEGPIVAGHASATAGISCISLGSPGSVGTVVDVGINAALCAAAKTTAPQVDSLRAKATRIRQTVEPLMRNQKALTPQQREKATELLFEADDHDAKAVELVEGLRKVASESETKVVPEVIVRETLHSGVTIRFPGVFTVIDRALQGPLRIITRTIHNDTRIAIIYGSSNTAHPLLTHADPNDSTAILRRLLPGEGNAADAGKPAPEGRASKTLAKAA